MFPFIPDTFPELPEIPMGTSTPSERDSPRRVRLMLVEHDDMCRRRLTDALSSVGFDVAAHGSARLAIESFRAVFQATDLVLLDFDHPGEDGYTAYMWFRYIDPNARVMLMTNQARREPRLDQALRKGALGVMSRDAAYFTGSSRAECDGTCTPSISTAFPVQLNPSLRPPGIRHFDGT